MAKQSPRHWVGRLSNYENAGFVLFDRRLPCRSPHEVWLYHFNSNQLCNHFKYPVREHLKVLAPDDVIMIEKVKTFYLEYKLRYYRELSEFLRSSFFYKLPEEFSTLRYYDEGKGKDWYEFFYGDPDWELVKTEGTFCLG